MLAHADVAKTPYVARNASGVSTGAPVAAKPMLHVIATNPLSRALLSSDDTAATRPTSSTKALDAGASDSTFFKASGAVDLRREKTRRVAGTPTRDAARMAIIRIRLWDARSAAVKPGGMGVLPGTDLPAVHSRGLWT